MHNAHSFFLSLSQFSCSFVTFSHFQINSFPFFLIQLMQGTKKGIKNAISSFWATQSSENQKWWPSKARNIHFHRCLEMNHIQSSIYRFWFGIMIYDTYLFLPWPMNILVRKKKINNISHELSHGKFFSFVLQTIFLFQLCNESRLPNDNNQQNVMNLKWFV